jgi:hypothetical protein
LFLLASPASRGREWVQHECGYAAAREELKFYVVVAVPSHLDAVPEPERGRVAVTLNDGRSIHAFVRQLQKSLLKESPPTTDLIQAQLAVVDRSAEIALREARAHADSAKAERDRLASALEGERQQFTHERTRFQQTLGRLRLLSTALVLAMVAVIGWSVWDRQGLRQTLQTQFDTEKQKLLDTWSGEMQQVNAEREVQQRSWPFSGLILDRQDRVVRCTEVKAHPGGRKEAVTAACDSTGQFTFKDGLDVLPEEPFSLTVMVGGVSLSPPSTTRREVPAVFYARGGGQ